VGISSFSRVVYNIFIQLKNSNILYDERVKPNVINWFTLTNSNFIFEVNTEDDVDEVISLLQDVGIPKNRVFLCPVRDYKLILEKCKIHGFCFAPWIKLN
jgi:hypothetical protein